MKFIILTFVVVAGTMLATWALHRNLERREHSRRLRAQFFSLADDLVGKPELPLAHAGMLVAMSAIPAGWLTRFMVGRFFYELAAGNSDVKSPLSIEHVPVNLRAKYVLALLSFVMSDSYRCAFAGPVFRRANSWIGKAILEIKPDVNAHATQVVTSQMAEFRAFKRDPQIDGLCVA